MKTLCGVDKKRSSEEEAKEEDGVCVLVHMKNLSVGEQVTPPRSISSGAVGGEEKE